MLSHMSLELISAIHALHNMQMCEKGVKIYFIVPSTIVGCGSKSRAWG